MAFAPLKERFVVSLSKRLKLKNMQNVRYITDASGHKTAVIVPIENYEEMLEDLHFGKIARESRDESKRDFNYFYTKCEPTGIEKKT